MNQVEPPNGHVHLFSMQTSFSLTLRHVLPKSLGMSFRNPLRNWNKKPPPIKVFLKLFTKFLKVDGIGYIMSCSEIVSVKPANDIPSVSARKRVSAGYTAHESI